ncbi:MAG: S1 RNA-binding domain-containing protein [Chloroflexi bacterium]|nr:S1 RNA-binding domain-containing protein [Chloroflexota bacterium]
MDVHPMEDLLAEGYDFRLPQRGEIVEGMIVEVSPGGLVIDIGSKYEGVLVDRELQSITPQELASFKVGDKIRVCVVAGEDKNGHILLSRDEALKELDWDVAQELLDQDEVYEGSIATYNKGGLIVNIGRLRGFVPASQLVRGRRESEGNDKDTPDYAARVGKPISVKVLELNREQNRLILSERAAQRRRRDQKGELLTELKEGDVRTGEVSHLADFGAFVNLGGADGLIHISELSWTRVNHPSEVVQVGDEVEVYVLSVDQERRRIGLSLKRLQPEPWTTVEERFKVGQLTQGTVSKLAPFGAFARLEGDIEGLIHISELSDQPVQNPAEVVKEGDVVNLRVLRVDTERKRIALSLRRANDDVGLLEETIPTGTEESEIEGNGNT